jgi:two-component system response regulator
MNVQDNLLRPIVAVDDEEDDRFFFSRLLRKAGVALPVRTFAGGGEAKKALTAAHASGIRPCACFLDVKMPGVTGFDVLAWIRANGAFDRLPVFMLSSSDHPSDLRRAEELGAQGYFRKHPSEAEVRQIITLVTSAAGGTEVNWTNCAANLFVRGLKES